jgi:hypothetical protein
VFTVVFGILQKSEIFGKGKKQIDAIVALVIGLLVISFGRAIGIIVQLSAFLAVALVVVLVFMLLVGSFNEEGDTDEVFGKIKWLIGVPVLIGFFIAVLYIIGAWDYIGEYVFLIGDGGAWITNVIFVLIIAGAVWAVLRGSGHGDSGKEKDKE